MTGKSNDDSRRARCFVRANRSGALATVDTHHDGAPANALVTYACDLDGSPIFLLSTLSDHTRNLLSDRRAALLIEATKNRRNPQTGPRVTLTGPVTKVGKAVLPRARQRFLARHPDAALYAGFGDFSFYRMSIERVHWVGGFAQARWIPAKRIVFSDKKAISAIGDAAGSVVEHMNDDHADAIDLCAQRLLGRRGNGWQMTGLDPDGCDLRRGPYSARLDFAEPVRDVPECRETLVALTQEARNKTPR